jgi:hypothetical protein
MTSFTNTVSDCLVFKLEEVESITEKIDTTLYIIYDKKNSKYLIRGSRRLSSKYEPCTYSFECEFAHELADFIEYLICPKNRINEILYSYDNLPEDPNEITFDFLNEYECEDVEISGYNDFKLKRRRLLRNLRMLRNVFNYY